MAKGRKHQSVQWQTPWKWFDVPPAAFSSEWIILFPDVASALVLFEHVIDHVLPQLRIDLFGETLVRAFLQSVFLSKHQLRLD
jgi:hypothetical protein